MDRDLEHEELVLVEKINLLINSKTSIDEVFKAIIDGMVNVFGYYSAGAYLLSEDKKHLIIKDFFIDSRVGRGIERLIGFKLKGYKIPLFDGSLLKTAMDNMSIIMVNNFSEIKKIIEHHTAKSSLKRLAAPLAEMSGLRSGVGIPLVAENEVVGMIGISSSERNLNEKDVQMLQTFGVQAALAIKKAKMYEELEDYSKNLELKVDEKTKELRLAHIRLIESEKFAAMGKLAAGVAHEINNPLGNISLAAELIMKRENDPYKIKKLEMVLEQVENTSEIVKNLLAYSRGSELKLRRIDLNNEIEKTLSLSKHQLTISKIDLTMNLSSDLPEIEADPKKLQQVFINIITNATQAMAKGGTLTVTTYQDNGYIAVEFIDSGTGIPKNVRDKIFDPFFTTKEMSTNTGLGLSVSRGIINEHHGTIEIENNRKRGTKMTIRIPGVKE
jgi:signal transduction histidine kinase